MLTKIATGIDRCGIEEGKILSGSCAGCGILVAPARTGMIGTALFIAVSTSRRTKSVSLSILLAPPLPAPSQRWPTMTNRMSL